MPRTTLIPRGTTVSYDRQHRLLQFLGRYLAERGFLPSVREVMQFLRVRSTNTAQYHLKNLEKEGYLQRERGRARAFQLTEKARRMLGAMDRRMGRVAADLADSVRGLAAPARRSIPLLGRITAGALDLAVEDALGSVDLAEFVRADENTFALRVDGDSMAGAGILDGDVVIVRRQSALQNGEIGVVLVDGETTVKYVSVEGEEVVLRPANERYRDIRIARSRPGLQVLGRVIGVLRRL